MLHTARHDAVTKTAKRGRSSADVRTTHHPGCAVSQRIRKCIEVPFGWTKTIARLAKTKFKSTRRAGFQVTFAMAADNLIRRPRLLAGSVMVRHTRLQPGMSSANPDTPRCQVPHGLANAICCRSKLNHLPEQFAFATRSASMGGRVPAVRI